MPARWAAVARKGAELPHAARPRILLAGAHIPGTERSPAVTSGHAGVEICIQEEHGGYGRIWLDTPSRRFGTVRPRVQIPGPRPISELRPFLLAVRDRLSLVGQRR